MGPPVPLPQAFAKRGMAKLTAEEKVTSTSTGIGMLYTKRALDIELLFVVVCCCLLF